MRAVSDTISGGGGGGGGGTFSEVILEHLDRVGIAILSQI